MFKNILCMTALAAVVAPAFAAEWMSDFEAAKAKAAQESKAILVDFTGSDWCGFCIKLRKEVLDTPAFEQYAADKFVLMEVDVPKRKKLDPAVMEQNKTLCDQYNVEGFPTLLVMTPEGKVMGGFSGYRPTVEAASEPLNAALATWELVKKADAATGDDKAKLLMEAYNSVPADIRNSTTLRQEVLAADTNQVTGMQDALKDEQQMAELMGKVDECGDDLQLIKTTLEQALATASPANKALIERELKSVEGMIAMEEIEAKSMAEGLKPAIALAEEKLATAEGDQKLMMLSAKFELQMLASETEQDLQAAKATLMELRALLPAPAQAGVDEMTAKEFADTEKLLQHIKKQRDQFEQERAAQKK